MENHLNMFFDAKGIAIVGASTNPAKLSHGVVKNLTQNGFTGAIYPINPKGDQIMGHQVYRNILDVPDPIDLAVIMLNAQSVPIAVEECGQRGIKAVVVISGGFRETGAEGERLELALQNIIDVYHMRLIGPNCVGVMDTYIPLDTTFIAKMPVKGHIGFVSHSGAICGGTIDWANSVGVGFSRIISLGNQIDVDIADGIISLDQDVNTRVINVYAEGLPNGRRFVEAAVQTYRHKPIVMLKAGNSTSGSRAVSSHTGALAGSMNAYMAACHRGGTLVVHSLQEQTDVARCLASQPIPHGNRVALLTNAGGPAALAADALDKHGLCMANLSEETKSKLIAVTPHGTQLDNPVDMLGGPQATMYRDAGRIILDDPGVDMLMSIFVPQALTPVNDVAQGVIDSATRHDKPVVCCLVGGYSITEAVQMLNTHDIPCYQDPNRASRALAGLLQYQQLRSREDLTPILLTDIDQDMVKRMLTPRQQKNGKGFISPQLAANVLHAYGIPVPSSEIASSVEEAISLAEKFNYPVALKLIAEGVIHKVDVGGLALNLSDALQVRQAYHRIIGDNSGHQAMIQSMVYPGTEVIIGIQRDPQFGPVLMFGAGGTLVEINRDVAFRLAPLCRRDALDMIQETAIGQVLKGLRGSQASDIESVVDVLVRVGQLAADIPVIAELDINPLIVYPQNGGCWAVDVRIALDHMVIDL
jgi:acetyl coenzyme A synthetase (ADP forming)-like protein